MGCELVVLRRVMLFTTQLLRADCCKSSFWTLQAQTPVETSKEKGWMDLLNPRYRWIMLLATLLPLFQQLSGINTCILYSSEVSFEASAQ